MTINEYQRMALRTESNLDEQKLHHKRLLQGLMGLNGEAGECIDVLKKHLFQDHWFDREHLAKELGDVAWYLAISADAICGKGRTDPRPLFTTEIWPLPSFSRF